MTERPDPGNEALFVDVLLELVGRRRLLVLIDGDAPARARLLARLAEHLRAGDGLVECRAPACGLPDDPDRLLAELMPRLETAPLGVLIVDGADALDPGRLSRLVGMAASDTPARRTLQVLLAGGPALEAALDAPGLRDIVARIGTVRRAPAPAAPALAPPAAATRQAATRQSATRQAATRQAAARAAAAWWPPRRRVAAAALLPLAFLGGLAANAAADRMGSPDVPLQQVEIARLLVPAPLAQPPQAQAPAVASLAGPADAAALELAAPPEEAGPEPRREGLAAAGDAVAGGVPLPVPKPAAGAGPRRTAPSRDQSPPRRQRAQTVAAVEDGCRRGPGGQTVTEPTLPAILRGFVADLRSLGDCLGGEAPNR